MKEEEDPTVCTQSETKRIIYFRGHKREQKSAMITKVAMHYETFSLLLKGQAEFAARTVSNLYNLQTVRGALTSDGVLDLEASMSGPHQYYGFLDPREYHTVAFDSKSNPEFRRHPNYSPNAEPKKPIDERHIVSLRRYNWIKGRDIKRRDMRKYGLSYADEDSDFLACDSPDEPKVILRASQEEVMKQSKEARKRKKKSAATGKENENNEKNDDSLFEYPGVLEFEEEEITFVPLTNAHEYDLSEFKAQVVANDTPFAFTREWVDEYHHAQHKLRVITYCYGPRYVSDYLMAGNGIFIERHDFIQSITPMLPECGGAVLLGRMVPRERGKENENEKEKEEEDGGVPEQDEELQLIAVRVPYGYTLLVEPQCIHGDSCMTGMFLMSMTGNHVAMQTADTVFMKNKATSDNLEIIFADAEEMDLNEEDGSNKFQIADMPDSIRPILTSSHTSLEEVKDIDKKIKEQIAEAVRSSSMFGILKSAIWQPVIVTYTWWEKTRGIYLPS